MFPPDPKMKNGFYNEEIYRQALDLYPSVVKLLKSKGEENKDKTWIIFKNEKYSYKETDNISSGIASGLIGLGAKRGDKIAIYAFNSPQWLFSYFGILKAGCIPVTVNTGFIKDPLVYNIDMPESRFLFLDSRLAGNYLAVKDNLPYLEKIILIGNENGLPQKLENTVTFETLLKTYSIKEDSELKGSNC